MFGPFSHTRLTHRQLAARQGEGAIAALIPGVLWAAVAFRHTPSLAFFPLYIEALSVVSATVHHSALREAAGAQLLDRLQSHLQAQANFEGLLALLAPVRLTPTLLPSAHVVVQGLGFPSTSAAAASVIAALPNSSFRPLISSRANCPSLLCLLALLPWIHMQLQHHDRSGQVRFRSVSCAFRSCAHSIQVIEVLQQLQASEGLSEPLAAALVAPAKHKDGSRQADSFLRSVCAALLKQATAEGSLGSCCAFLGSLIGAAPAKMQPSLVAVWQILLSRKHGTANLDAFQPVLRSVCLHGSEVQLGLSLPAISKTLRLAAKQPAGNGKDNSGDRCELARWPTLSRSVDPALRRTCSSHLRALIEAVPGLAVQSSNMRFMTVRQRNVARQLRTTPLNAASTSELLNILDELDSISEVSDSPPAAPSGAVLSAPVPRPPRMQTELLLASFDELPASAAFDGRSEASSEAAPSTKSPTARGSLLDEEPELPVLPAGEDPDGENPADLSSLVAAAEHIVVFNVADLAQATSFLASLS